MGTLADPKTDLDGFVRELANAARIVAPVSEQQAALFTSMADTFEALGRDEGALKDLIAKSPSTMDSGVESFQVQRPFLDDLTAFSNDFSGATEELRAALPPLNGAVEVGTPVQKRAVKLNDELAKTLDSVRELAEAPGTNAALRGLTATVTTLNPQMRFYGPYVTVCNSWNYFWTYLAEHFSEPDSTGQAQRALVNTSPRQEDSVGSMGADEPANGEDVKEGNAAYSQDQPYGAAIAPDGRADCETGQRGFLERQARFFPEKYHVARDPRSPGLQGPTFTGRPRVPKGQTFTAEPETGPVPRPSEVGAPMRSRSNTFIGIVALAVIAVGVYFGLDEGDPVPVALRGQGGVRELEQPAHRLAGADRRRRDRQGHGRRGRRHAARARW